MTGKGIFADYAWQYYKLGMNVMPVQDRKPLVCDYNTMWYGHRQTEDELEQLIDDWGYCNGIAMVCGLFGTMLDVDTPENDAGLMALAPKTPMMRFGSKGMGFLYRGAPFDKLKPDALPVELFGRGYVVLPPSYHAKADCYYRWEQPFQMTLIEELPGFTMDHWRAIEKYCFEHSIFKVGISRDSDGNVRGDGDGRYNKISNYIWKLVKTPGRNNQPRAAIIDEILAYDREKFGAQAWFEDKDDMSHKAPRQKCEYYLAKAEKSRAKKDGIVITPSAQYLDPIDLYIETPKVISAPLEEGLIPKGGIMEGIHHLVTSLNGHENVMQSLVAGIGLCSILAGHKVVVGRAHPNLFLLSTAISGRGKGAPQKAIMNTLRASVNGASLIGASEYASAQALSHNLAKSRKRIDIIDECKNLFMGNANNQSHLVGIDAELCKIFSASDSYLPRKFAVKSDSERAALQNPYLTLVMFSTPGSFHRYFSRMLAEEGFGGRTLFFNDQTDPTEGKRGIIGFGDAVESKLPNEAMDRVNYWLTMERPCLDASGRVVAYAEAGGIPDCHKLAVSQDALDLLEAYQVEYFTKAKAAFMPGDTDYELKACFMRAIELHLKLLGVWVISQGDEYTEIGIEQVKWAHKIVELSGIGLRQLLQGAELATEAEEDIRRYASWAKDKESVQKKHLSQWIRRIKKTGDMRVVSNFVTMLVEGGYGHFEQEEKQYPASNGRVRSKWVFAHSDNEDL